MDGKAIILSAAMKAPLPGLQVQTTLLVASSTPTSAAQRVAFAASGDQILAYQGADSNPTFIYALNSEGTGWQSDATSSNTSQGKRI